MNKANNTTLINGIAAEYLSVNDRSIHYGDGVFETILCENNQLLYWRKHYQRLKASLEKLKINCPDEGLLLSDVRGLLDANNESLTKNYVIKIIVSRGATERGYQFSSAASVNRIVSLSVLVPDYSSLISGKLFSGDLHVCNQQVSINESLAGMKHLNRLENVMARNEWNQKKDKAIIDGIMLNANNYVIEGTMSNLFGVIDNHLYTPKLNCSGVHGIMRDVVIDIAKSLALDVSVVDITLDTFKAMDEVFITNSLIGLKSINSMPSKSFDAHEVTSEIFTELLKTKGRHAQTA